jgi:hypothetical protein
MARCSIRIVSGGQTGAGRAALDWALANRITHHGWCPKGRKAEDGVIPRRYRLKETRSAASTVRTRWNVRDSDGTVIFSLARTLSGGSRLTAEFAKKFEKPLLHLTGAAGATVQGRRLARFIRQHQIRTLNIAGPRASEEPGVARFVLAVLSRSRLLAQRGHPATPARPPKC